MRPVQLEVTNFGPYRKEVINFTQFDDAPLFLIAGDTGAGKSTLFDAMTVGLFGTTSGDRNAEEMRSTFASPQDDLTKVTFYFQQGNHLYRIERVLKQERVKRGGGTTIREPKASLVIVDQVGGQEVQKLADKIKEVNTEIEQILGLNAEQFKQIILLPQNDFSRFLKEDSKNKTQILKKIFGTGLFDRFKRSLEDRYRESNKILAKNQSRLEGHFTSQVWSEEELQVLAATPESEKLAEAAYLLAKRQEQVQKEQSLTKKAEQNLQELEETVQEARELAKTFSTYEDLKERYQGEILDLVDQYQEQVQHLAELEFAKSLQKEVASRDSLTKQVQSLTEELAQEQKAFKEHTSDLDKLSKDLSQLEDQAKDFAKKKTALDQWQEELIHAQTLETERAQAKKDDQAWQKAQQVLQEVTAETKTLAETVEDLQERGLSSDVLVQAEKNYQVLEGMIKGRLDQTAQELELKKGQYQLQRQRQDGLELEVKAVTEDLAKLESELAASLNDRRQLMIAQLQSELEEGQACMVCGSLDHPHVDGAVADEAALKALMDKVEKLQKERDIKRAEQSRLEATLLEVESQVTELEDQLQGVQNLLAEQEQALQEALSDWTDLTLEQPYSPHDGEALLQQAAQQLDALKTQYVKEQAALKQAQEQLEKSQKRLATAQLETKAAETSHQQTQSRLAQLEASHPQLESAQTYKNRILATKQTLEVYEKERESKRQAYQAVLLGQEKRQGQIDSLSKTLDQHQADLAQVQDLITRQLTANSALTHDPDQLHAWLGQLKDQVDLTLQAQVTAYETNKDNLEQDLAKLQEAVEGKEAPQVAPLEEALAARRAELDQLKASLSIGQEGLKAVQATYQAAKNLQDQHRVVFTEFQELSDLVKVVKGDGGVRTGKLDLEVYVIRQYFQQILEYANNHYIGLLTDNRYSFILSEEARKASQHYGLDINVYDQLTGSQRSVKSLSGGETFIAALAIALSLSEVVQNTSRGAVVEALFIDEGFGSLDKEALSKAISVLEQIGENRMVGVISHVDDMKDTIAQQLAIRKEHDGSSRIQIIDKG